MRPRTLRLALAKATTTLIGAFLVLGISLIGCSSDDGGGTPTFPIVGEDVALVRVGHLSPDAGAVNVRVNEGQPGGFAADGVEFGDFSRFTEIPATFDGAQVEVVVSAAGGAEALRETVTVLRGQVVTVAVVGRVGALSAALVRSTVEPTNGEATVDFVHAAPDVGPVAVTQLRISSPPLFSSTDFGSAAVTAVRVDPGSYSFEVRDAETNSVALAFVDVPLAATTNYTIWAVERPSGELGAIVTVDALEVDTATVSLTPALTSFRAAHLALEVESTVDVLLDGEIIPGYEDVGYAEIGATIDLLSGTHRIQIFDADPDTTLDENPAYLDETVTLEPASNTTFVITGNTGSDQPAGLPAVLGYRNEQRPSTGGIVRVFHASAFAQTIDVFLIADPEGTASETLLATLDPEDPPTPFRNVAAGAYLLSIRRPDFNDSEIYTRDLTVEDGDVINLHFVGERNFLGNERDLQLIADLQPDGAE